MENRIYGRGKKSETMKGEGIKEVVIDLLDTAIKKITNPTMKAIGLKGHKDTSYATTHRENEALRARDKKQEQRYGGMGEAKGEGRARGEGKSSSTRGQQISKIMSEAKANGKPMTLGEASKKLASLKK